MGGVDGCVLMSYSKSDMRKTNRSQCKHSINAVAFITVESIQNVIQD